MIKKIILISIFFCLIYSCGKKMEPEYKAKKDNILINKA